MKKMLIVCLFLVAAGSLFAETLPDWFIPLRETVYEQEQKSDEVSKLSGQIEAKARLMLSGFSLDAILARCEYYKGRSYQYDGMNKLAISHYENGMAYAEKSIKAQPSSEGYEILAANISQLCTLKSKLWVMLHGLDVEKYAKLALSYNAENANAQYMISARWIYAPSPFSDVGRGIVEMKDLLNGPYILTREDIFNANISVGYSLLRQKKPGEAESWIKKALEIYPTNKYAQDLLFGNEKPVEISIK
ncbi:hypothetical protein AGMMS49579_17310 [Spirochaetia bacterium]|nr:hypothetical protein AGMMS49579_17310 [Spirochaetia bacterium]